MRLKEARDAARKALDDGRSLGWSLPEDPPDWALRYLDWDACPADVEAFTIAWMMGAGEESITQIRVPGKWAVEIGNVRRVTPSESSARLLFDHVVRSAGLDMRDGETIRIVEVIP